MGEVWQEGLMGCVARGIDGGGVARGIDGGGVARGIDGGGVWQEGRMYRSHTFLDCRPFLDELLASGL